MLGDKEIIFTGRHAFIIADKCYQQNKIPTFMHISRGKFVKRAQN